MEEESEESQKPRGGFQGICCDCGRRGDVRRDFPLRDQQREEASQQVDPGVRPIDPDPVVHKTRSKGFAPATSMFPAIGPMSWTNSGNVLSDGGMADAEKAMIPKWQATRLGAVPANQKDGQGASATPGY